MQLRGDVAQRRGGRRGRLERAQRLGPAGPARVPVKQRAGHKPAEDPQAVRLPRAQPGSLDQGGERRQGEPPRRAGPLLRLFALQQLAGFGAPAGQRPVQDRGHRVGREHAHRGGRPEHGGDRGHRVSRLLHVLEHVVADDEVGRLGAHHAVQAARLALHRGQPRARLGGPPLRRRQRVRARVDHGDVVSQDGERHGQPAGPAAHVDDVQRLPAGLRHPGRDDVAQDIPDQREASAVAPEICRHASLLPGVQCSAGHRSVGAVTFRSGVVNFRDRPYVIQPCGTLRFLFTPPAGNSSAARAVHRMLFAMAEHLELPRPWRLILTAGWNLAESLGLPVAGYFVGAKLGGRDAGMLAATAVVWLTVVGRKVLTRGVPGLLTISALVLTLQTAVVIVTGSMLFFLLQFPLANLGLCVLFARTAPTRKPLVAQLAAEVVALRQPSSHHPGLHRFFQGATWLWAGIFFVTTVGLAVLMTFETVKVFLLLTTAVTIGGTVAGTLLSAFWFFRVLHRFGLRVRFAQP